MHNKVFFKFIILICVVSLSGCATMQIKDLFSGYAQQMEPMQQQLRNGQVEEANNLLEMRAPTDTSYILSLLEKGRMAQLAGHYEQSLALFVTAINYVEDSQLQAKIQFSHGLQNISSVITNDNAITYQMADYEKSMLHSYQALNYLYLGDFEAAMVEIRRANLIQNTALVNNQDAITKIAEQSEQQFDIDWQSISSTYPDMKSVIGSAKNGFQNAYTFYLSAVLYEAAGELDDAYIDYKKALEIFPNNRYIQQDVLKLATKLGMQDDLVTYHQQFSALKQTHSDYQKNNQGQVVVLFENSLVSPRDEMVLRLPIYTSKDEMRFYSLALPVYQVNHNNSLNANLRIDDSRFELLDIVNVEALAAQTLKSQLPSMITRQIIRLIAKEKMRKKMAKEGGDIGNILANIYNLTSERADTRSWLSLPKTTQMMRTHLSSGVHELSFNIGMNEQKIDITVNPKQITLVNVTAVGSFISYRTTHL